MLFHLINFLVTEEEIRSGLLKQAEGANDHCLCFIRIINDLDTNLDHPKAWRYVDMGEGGRLDEDAKRHLEKLRDSLVVSKLERKNVYR